VTAKSTKTTDILQTVVAIRCNGPARDLSTTEHRVTFLRLSIKRRHRRTLLIAPPGDVESDMQYAGPKGAPSFDLPLIRTLGKTFYWQKLLDSGDVPTITALAHRLNLEPGWVAEVLRMTRLAPDIVQAVLSGTQPRHLNLHALRGRQAMAPLDWQEQRRVFGFVPLFVSI
jgi:hypothetical protein